MNLASFPRHPLTFGPSPVHPLERLTAHLGGASLWAKRDDCNSGLAFGGNKTRKLEYLVADALAQGCDTLVSIGGVQSNHTRQVAAVAARTGLRLRAGPGELGRLARRGLRPRRQHPAQPHHGRRRAARPGRLRHRLQGELGAGARRRRGARRQALRDPGRRVRPPARRPRLRALGARGGASRSASSASSSTPIIVCSVTGSTQAGMIAGFAAQERPRRVIGIDGSAKPRGDARAGGADRAAHRGADRGRAASCATTRSSSTTATTPAPTASRTSRRSTRSGSPAGSRG